MSRASPRLPSVLGGVIAASAGIVGLVGVAAAQGGTTTPNVDSARSVVHILGIVVSLLLVYYGYRASEQFRGGALGEAARYVSVGGVLFAVAFVHQELSHGFGVNVFAPAGGMQMRMALSMFLFTGTVFAFGWAYYQLATELKGWFA